MRPLFVYFYAGQQVSSERACVYVDPIGSEIRFRHWRVAMHDDAPKIAFVVEKFPSDAQEITDRLVLQLDPWPKTGVYEEIWPGFEIGFGIAIEPGVRLGEALGQGAPDRLSWRIARKQSRCHPVG